MAEDYNEHNVESLRKIAGSRKIPGRAEMNKDELVSALQADDTASDRVGALERRVTRLELLVSGDQPNTTIPQRR